MTTKYIFHAAAAFATALAAASVLAQTSAPTSRAEVKAKRDEFLSMNRWDQISGAYVPIKAAPRQLSSMTREQVRAETRQFMAVHEWDELSAVWVLKAPRKTGS